MSASQARQVPEPRRASFPMLARTTVTEKVLIVCRDSIVARQYRRGVAAAGGNPDNLRFLFIPKGAA